MCPAKRQPLEDFLIYTCSQNLSLRELGVS